MTRRRPPPGPRVLRADLLGLSALVVLGTWVAVRWVEARIGAAVERRIGAALDGRCDGATVRLRPPLSVRVTGLRCERDGGRLGSLVFDRIDVQAASFPKALALPPIRSVVVDGGTVVLRLRPEDGILPTTAERGEQSPGSEAPAEADPQPAEGEAKASPVSVEAEESRIERWARRFFPLQAEFVRGGGRLVAIHRALSPLDAGGRLVLRGLRIDDDAGHTILQGVGAQVDKDGEAIGIAVAAGLTLGGVAAVDLRIDGAGLSEVKVRAEDLPLAPALSEIGSALPLRDGRLFSELRGARSAPWALDVRLQDAVVQHEILGDELLRFPALGFAGELVGDEGRRSLRLAQARWSVGGVGGALDAALLGLASGDPEDVGASGPPGAKEGDGGATLQVLLSADRLPLGELLSALPDQLIPKSWAEEVQGTMDLGVRLSGPVRDRAAWDLDWDWDFSRMVLAEGRLSREVQGLLGAFVHTFPKSGGSAERTQRTIGPEDPHFVALSDLSPHLKAAVVTTEDAGFWGHRGFEPTEIREAVLENLRSGEGRGGSTITQQLAKNLFLSGERTAARKLQEALLAWRLEADLPKERILEIYMNIAEWGPGMFGARDAAWHYFGRDPSRLEPQEAAFLASLLPSPVRYHGYYHRSGLTENRQERVLEILATMLRLQRLTQEEYDRAIAAPIEFAPCGG